MITARDICREQFATFEPVQVFKSIDCYTYQSCEHEEWETSAAHAFCTALRKRACSACVGYDDAKWGAPPTPEQARADYRAKSRTA